MPSYTGQELIDRAADAADMHDNFVKPATWLRWASLERYALELLMARSGWPTDLATGTITVTGAEAGEFTVAADPDMMAVVVVHEIESDGLRRLKYTDAVTFLHQVPGSPVHTSSDVGFYRVKRDNDGITFNFFPNPSPGVQILVTYIPMPARLTTTASTVNYPMGWEERIVLGMARRALAKEESDTSEIRGQYKDISDQVEQLSWNRVMSESPSVRNVDRQALELPAREYWAWV
jgi:hypothetical protein